MEEKKVAKLLDNRRNGWLNDLDCTQQIRSLKHSMKFTLKDHQELGNRMHRTLNQYKPIKVSPSRKTTIHLELVCAILTEKLQEEVQMSEKTASSKAGSEIEIKPVSDNSSSSKSVNQKDSVVVAQTSDPVATPSTLSPASSDTSKVTNPESKVESTVSSNATHIHYYDQPKVKVLTADMLSGLPRKRPSAASIHLHDTPNQLSNTASSSVTSPTSTIGTGVQSGAQNTSGKAHFSIGTPMLSNMATKACLPETDEVLICSSLEKGKMENKADAKTNAKADAKTSPELPVMEQKFTMAVQPTLINVTKLQEEKGKNKTAGIEVKNKLNENLIAVQTVNDQKCAYDWNRKKNILMDKKERGHTLEGDAKDLSKSEGMVNRPKPKPYPNPRSGITLRLKGNGPRTEPAEVIVIEDLSDEDEDH